MYSIMVKIKAMWSDPVVKGYQMYISVSLKLSLVQLDFSSYL